MIQYIGNSKIDLVDLLVYYEVPLGQRDEVKQRFQNKTNIIINNNNKNIYY